MTARVFVYGTLKKGHGNHRLLETSQFLGRCKLYDHFRLVSLGGFPGLVKVPEDQPKCEVSGEVYAVTDDVLTSLDYLEGHPRFYERQKVKTPFKNAWAYFLPDAYLRYPLVATSWKPSPEEIEWLKAQIEAGDTSNAATTG